MCQARTIAIKRFKASFALSELRVTNVSRFEFQGFFFEFMDEWSITTHYLTISSLTINDNYTRCVKGYTFFRLQNWNQAQSWKSCFSCSLWQFYSVWLNRYVMIIITDSYWLAHKSHDHIMKWRMITRLLNELLWESYFKWFCKNQEKSAIRSINYNLSCNEKLFQINVTHNNKKDDFIFNITFQSFVVLTEMKVEKQQNFCSVSNWNIFTVQHNPRNSKWPERFKLPGGVPKYPDRSLSIQ